MVNQSTSTGRDASIRKVCVVLVDRANYGRLKPVMQAVKDHPELHLQTICAGTMVLERFDQPVKIVARDGFEISGQIYTELEGSIPVTMAKSVGFGTVEFASEFQRLQPDVILMIGDRYEAIAAAMAAAYMNIPICHLQGGEVSGSIDESARHCITKLSQFHFPATERAKDFLLRMGEHEHTVLGVGCPSSDLARQMTVDLPSGVVNDRGSGCEIDVAKPFLLVVFHPTTTEFGDEREQMAQLLAGLDDVQMQTVLLWPNIDAGSDHISKAIREFRSLRNVNFLRTLTNLTPDDYLQVLASAACAVGNSSSFVRDAGFFGTPVVLVGNRQANRERDVHVTPVPAVRKTVGDAVQKQLAHGRYPPSTLYGDGHVSARVADGLAKAELYVQKHLSYVELQSVT